MKSRRQNSVFEGIGRALRFIYDPRPYRERSKLIGFEEDRSVTTGMAVVELRREAEKQVACDPKKDTVGKAADHLKRVSQSITAASSLSERQPVPLTLDAALRRLAEKI